MTILKYSLNFINFLIFCLDIYFSLTKIIKTVIYNFQTFIYFNRDNTLIFCRIEIQISFVIPMRQNLTQCRSLMITLGEQFYAQRIMRIHSSRAFQGRRRTDTWVHQNGKVLGLATLSTLRGSREKRSSSAGRRPLGASVCFSRRKKEKERQKKTVGGGEGGEGWQSSLTFVRY